MEWEGIETVTKASVKKVEFFKAAKLRYFVYAMIAGCFCTIGMVFAYSAGAAFYDSAAVAGLYKLAVGIGFALSFTLIVFAGSELFTGNMFVMTIGTLEKKTALKQSVSLLAFCYGANIFGAVLMGLLFASTGLLDSTMGSLLLSTCRIKTEIPFFQALSRGILCNILVCLGTWCTYKLKSEVAKMILLAWVVAGFVTPGYEHSIANAGLFTMSMLVPSAENLMTVQGILLNMIPVTLGNIIGGGFFVGFGYWFSGRKTN